ncbi:nucleotidyltransferase domain-containing protein [Fuchsiella alkaliacetigena]|uniref:nucleotidyltransferase domain-containing protein n=1 Tax=Fuchsiella alkaliacetigena TaxID=957042 RepID=UPI00200B2CB9|nr:nucleotidyltransferase domain-containing protein [Fuchsiella alkaliacetigena]MCK8825542.1 nucleotidyltransferase domain-containing protein [Fuchsiella alkaliacetigena]
MKATKSKEITQEEIYEIVKKLAETYEPETELIYLFGSYAWGDPNQNSDLDLMIIVNNSDLKKHKRSVKAYEVLWDLDISVDVLVYTKEEYKQLLNDEYSFCSHIVKEGEKIYES